MNKAQERARLGVRPAIEGFDEEPISPDWLVVAAVLVMIAALVVNDALGLGWFAP